MDYARRKLTKLQSRPPKKRRKSKSLDENDQLKLNPLDQEFLASVRERFPPADAREMVHLYYEERLKAAKRVFNDPIEVEKIIEILEAAERAADR